MLENEKHPPKTAESSVWFAMSATFGREIKAKSYLEENATECFIPLRYEVIRNSRGIRERRLVPAVRNLLFVHTTPARIRELKSGLPYLQYHTQPVNGKNVPIIVPDRQMGPFIKVCETLCADLVYLAPEEVNLEKGTRVRIVGSAFDGVEGTFVKVKKRRDKHVVVILQGVAAVMITEISDGFIEVLS